MSDQPGEMPADTDQAATAGDEDTQAQELLADAVASADNDSGEKPSELPTPEEWAKTRAALKKANEEAKNNRLKLKEFEDAQLTEKERIEKERDEARESATTTAQKLALMEAAVEYSLSKEDLELLEGVPAEQIDARAKRLSERLAKTTPTTPKPDPQQGGRSGAGMDVDSRIAEAQKAGDWKTVISLQNQKLANT